MHSTPATLGAHSDGRRSVNVRLVVAIVVFLALLLVWLMSAGDFDPCAPPADAQTALCDK